MSVSIFTQGGTPKPLISPLGTSRQQPLPLDRASPTPFPHQDGVSDASETPLPYPPDVSIYSSGGRGVKGDIKRVEEGYLKLLPLTNAAGLLAGGRRDIDDNKNKRVEV